MLSHFRRRSVNRQIFATVSAGMLSFASVILTLLPAAVIAQTHPNTQRLNFAAGETAIVLRNSSHPQRYVLRATAGQTIRVEVRSQSRVGLAIEGTNQRILLPASVGSTVWSGQITTTGDYYISVLGPNAATYILGIISPAPTSNVPFDAQRVQFVAGATTTRLTGNLAPYSVQTYLISGRAGQAVELTLDAADRNSFLTLYGVDGTVLVDGTLSGESHWNGRFPITQEYVVQVSNPTGRTTHYMLPISLFNSILIH